MTAARAYAHGDRDEVGRVLRVQAARLQGVDPRIRLPTDPGTDGGRALVANAADGRATGYARPALVELDGDDEMRAFMPDRAVALRRPAFLDADAVGAVLAAAAVDGAADLLMWPSTDPGAESLFAPSGLRRNACLAVRPPGRMTARADVVVRPARPDETELVAALHLAELAFHTEFTSWVRVVPAVEQAFRARRASGGDGVHVVEHAGAVVGMCEWMLQTVSADAPWGLLAPGSYVHLNSVAVAEPARGRGLGRALTAGVLAATDALAPDGATLYFTWDNPIAREVWPRLGFAPLWTSWERRP